LDRGKGGRGLVGDERELSGKGRIEGVQKPRFIYFCCALAGMKWLRIGAALSGLVLLLIALRIANAPLGGESLATAVEGARQSLDNVSFLAAFIGGLLTLFAPCLLPFVPAYIAISAKARKNLTLVTACFFAGFTLVFVALGFSASLIGQFFILHRSLLVALSGILITVFGVMTLFSFGIPSPFRSAKPAASTYLGNFLFGVFFAVGWSPCVGPILFGILFLAANAATPFSAIMMMLAYSAGIAIAFLAISRLLESKGAKSLQWLAKPVRMFRGRVSVPRANLVAGLLLVLLGLSYLLLGGTSALNADFFGLWSLNYVVQSRLLALPLLRSSLFQLVFFALVITAFIALIWKRKKQDR